MAFQNLPSRVMQDVGLAAWFGGSLANAVSLTLTGSMIVVTSWAGEQQRPTAVVTGVLRRLNPFR